MTGKVDRTATDHDLNRKCAALLLTQTDWIHRRVESINFLPEGQTRRQISLDFDVPQHLRLYWDSSRAKLTDDKESTGTPHKQVAVPLTFIRKGALTAFDLQDASGASLTSLGRSTNGYFSLCALMFFPRVLGFNDAEMCVMENGAYCLIQSVRTRDNFDESALETGSIIKRDQDRQWAIRQLLSLLLRGFTQPTDSPDPDITSESNPTVTADPSVTDSYSEEDHFLKMVRLLTHKIDELVRDHPAAVTPQRKDHPASMMVALLTLMYSAADSFVLMTLLPEESASIRTMVKTGFNTAEEPRDVLPANLSGFLSRMGDFLSRIEVEHVQRILLSGLNAGSSHIEIASPSEVELPTPVICSCDQHGRREKGDKQDSESGVCPSDKVQIAETSARTHLTVSKFAGLPKVDIDLTLRVPLSVLRAVCAWVFFTSLIVGAVGLNFVTRSDSFEKFFTADNVLSLITVLFAISIALRISVGRHPVTRKIYEPLNRITMVGTLSAGITLLLAAVLTDSEGAIDGDVPAPGVVIWVFSIAALLWSVVLLVKCCHLVLIMIRRGREGTATPPKLRAFESHRQDHAEVSAFAVFTEANLQPAQIKREIIKTIDLGAWVSSQCVSPAVKHGRDSVECYCCVLRREGSGHAG